MAGKKDWKWWAGKFKGPIAVVVIAGAILWLSLLVQEPPPEVKESTVLSGPGNKAVVGFFLDGNKDFDVYVTIAGEPRNLIITIRSPYHEDMTNLQWQFVKEKYYLSSFKTTESGIYNFMAETNVQLRSITFAVREHYEFPSLVIPKFYAELLPFIGGGIIGFIIPVFHKRYIDGIAEPV